MSQKQVSKVQFHYQLKGFNFRERTRLKIFILKLFKQEGKSLDSLSYIFCSDDYLLSINQQFLNHDFYTDIITFNLSESVNLKGEIYISLERVLDNSLQYNTSQKEELHRVIFHGALHLCGYNDKSKADKIIMRRKEQAYLNLYWCS
ncbi:MAG: rRNA maturation RNase YbeY [Chitinophagaceae bacterium]